MMREIRAKTAWMSVLILFIMWAASQADAVRPVNTPWAWQPPDIDGNVSKGEWENADVISAPYSLLRVTRDQAFVYVLIEFYADASIDPEDGFQLSFAQGEVAHTPMPDVMYTFLDGALYRQQATTHANNVRASDGTAAIWARGMGPTVTSGYTSPKHRRPHQFWELRIPLNEIAHDFDRDVVLGLKSITSGQPDIQYADRDDLQNGARSQAPVLWVVYARSLAAERILEIERRHRLERLDVTTTGVYRYPIPPYQTARSLNLTSEEGVLFADSPQMAEWDAKVLYIAYSQDAAASAVERIEQKYGLTREGRFLDFVRYRLPDEYVVADIIAMLRDELIYREYELEYAAAPSADLNVFPDFFETTQLDPSSQEYQNARSVALIAAYDPARIIVHYREGTSDARRRAIAQAHELVVDGSESMPCQAGDAVCRYQIPSTKEIRDIARLLGTLPEISAVQLVLNLETRCTGFLVGPDIIWTADHCFEDAEDTHVAAVFNWEAGVPERNRSEYVCHIATTWRSPLDIALLRCESGPIDELDWRKPGEHWGMMRICDRTLAVADPIYIVHQNDCVGPNCEWFPGAANKKISFGIIDELGVMGNHLGHDADTLRGSSGAPVFLPGDHDVVAYHRGYAIDRNINLAVPMQILRTSLDQSGWWDRLHHCED